MNVSTGLICAKMIAIMRACSPIAKGRYNEQQRYSFRGIDDVYGSLHEVLAEHGVFTTSEILKETYSTHPTKSGGLMFYCALHVRYRFWAEDGSSVHTEVIGKGMDTGDKDANKAMSVAHKYAFLQSFTIGTEDLKDPENDNPQVIALVPKKAPAPPLDLNNYYTGTSEEKKYLWKLLQEIDMSDKKIAAWISDYLIPQKLILHNLPAAIVQAIDSPAFSGAHPKEAKNVSK